MSDVPITQRNNCLDLTLVPDAWCRAVLGVFYITYTYAITDQYVIMVISMRFKSALISSTVYFKLLMIISLGYTTSSSS